MALGAFFLAVATVLQRRRMADEHDREPLHEERCTVIFRPNRGWFIAGSNMPTARIAFYEEFFVVAMLRLTKLRYSAIDSLSSNAGWLSRSITIRIMGGPRLTFYPRRDDRILELLSERLRRRHSKPD